MVQHEQQVRRENPGKLADHIISSLDTFENKEEILKILFLRLSKRYDIDKRLKIDECEAADRQEEVKEVDQCQEQKDSTSPQE